MIFSIDMLKKREGKMLADYAVKSLNSEGRFFKEKKSSDRMPFQKDKERILHSKAFRRLDKKTQVFVSGSGDHFRTRLTHTLEVAQISKDICRRMGLNEDLAEAIALAHDLGHPPFGHVGEEAISEMMTRCGMHFEHNEQSKRIVEKLEKAYPNFEGLNLTKEVLEGLIKHQTAYDQKGKKFERSAHLEAQVVNIADEIAYTNHDIDDGIRSGLITLKQLRKLGLWKKAEASVHKTYGKILAEEVLISRTISHIISAMVEDLCDTTEKNLKQYKIKKLKDVKKFKGYLATFSKKMKSDVKEMRMFLFKNFYMNSHIKKSVVKGKKMIKEVFAFYLKNPKNLPSSSYANEKEPLQIRIKDYISGMTDLFLIREYEKHIMKKKKL